MTLTPKKFISNFTSSTSNRGVEAKEKEIANARLDMNASSSTHFPTESCSGSLEMQAAGDAVGANYTSHCQSDSPPTADETSSYVQVVVQKHRRKQEQLASIAAQTSPRLPVASSPLVKENANSCGPCGGAGGAGGATGVYLNVLPQHMLITYPTTSGQQHYSWPESRRTLVEAATSARSLVSCDKIKKKSYKTHVRDDNGKQNNGQVESEVENKTSVWQKLNNITNEKFKLCDNAPERVEVYYFEHTTGEYLATWDGAAPTLAERLAARGSRLPARLLAELLAAPQLLAALPVALLLRVERSILVVVRHAVVGGIQTASDYLLKPALALVFNALLQPPLVFLANVARAVRDAVRPLAYALGDLLEPVAKLVAAVRLVHVERPCGCSHAV